MAEYRIRAASIYVNGKKAAECNASNYTVDGNDEQQFGDSQVLGMSDGIVTSQLKITTVHPVGGMTTPSLFKAMLAKTYLDIAVATMDGAIHQIRMRVTQADVKSEQKNGSQMGDYSLVGGEPTIA